jgi:hypothetical protein
LDTNAGGPVQRPVAAAELPGKAARVMAASNIPIVRGRRLKLNLASLHWQQGYNNLVFPVSEKNAMAFLKIPVAEDRSPF